MRLHLAAATVLALAGAAGALAQSTTARLDDPTVKGKPIDYCADIDAENDCSARGQAKAAQKACIANGFSGQVASHWRPASRPAMHFVTEYDMHAGEVGGRWDEKPSSGTFDWVTCQK